MKEAMIPIKQTPEYIQGYSEGYNNGYYEAILKFQNILNTARSPHIIVTTQENLEQIQKE